MLKTHRREVLGMSSSRKLAVDPARQYEKKQNKITGPVKLVTCRRCLTRVEANHKGLPVWHDRPVSGSPNRTELCRKPM